MAGDQVQGPPKYTPGVIAAFGSGLTPVSMQSFHK